MNARVCVPSVARQAVHTLLWLTLGTGSLGAQQDGRPFARTQLEPGPSVTVGQPLVIQIEVLVPSFFSGAPNYPDVELKDALVLFVFRGVNFTERIDGVTWAGQRREYHVYPQRPGPYEIGDLPVGVRYRPLGGRSGETATDTASPPPIRFEADLPAGAEGLEYFISALSVELESSFDEPPETVLVGESFSRTVEATVQGSLSMVIPPLFGDAVPGLASYPGTPEVEDIEGFGVEAMVGRRMESVTYVAESEGEYTLPGIQLTWWDVEAQQLRETTLPELSFVVAANPALVEEIPLPPDSTDVPAIAEKGGTRWSLRDLARDWGLPLAVLVLMAAVGHRLIRNHIPRCKSAYVTARELRSESEQAYFRRFLDAAQKDDPRVVARALMAWLDRWWSAAGAPTLAAFADQTGDPELVDELTSLDRILYGPAEEDRDSPWSGSALVRLVTRARKRAGAEGHHRGTGASRTRELGALNPG